MSATQCKQSLLFYTASFFCSGNNNVSFVCDCSRILLVYGFFFQVTALHNNLQLCILLPSTFIETSRVCAGSTFPHKLSFWLEIHALELKITSVDQREEIIYGQIHLTVAAHEQRSNILWRMELFVLPGITGQCQGFAKSWHAQNATTAVSRDAGDSGACSATGHRNSQVLFSHENLWLWTEPKRVPRANDTTTAPCNVYPRAPSRALLMPQALGYI